MSAASHFFQHKSFCDICRKNVPSSSVVPDPRQDPKGVAALTHPKEVCRSHLPNILPPQKVYPAR